MTYDSFLQIENANAAIVDLKKSLLDLFLWNDIVKDDYEYFIKSNTYPKKDFDSFYQYYYDKTWQTALEKDSNATRVPWKKGGYEVCFYSKYEKEGEKGQYTGKKLCKIYIQPKENYEQQFYDLVIQNVQEYIRTFLDEKRGYENFILSIRNTRPYFLDVLSEQQIQDLYDEKHKEYQKEHWKNEFDLDNAYIDKQLERMLWYNQIWDGTFLYKWGKDKRDNAIVKYNKVRENILYKMIEPTEKWLFKYMLGGNIKLWISKKLKKHSKYYKIKDILTRSKTIVELGPWGVSKLLEYITMFCDSCNTTPGKFFGKKHTKLVDVSPLWYSKVKERLDEIIKMEKKWGVVEWIETNFKNEDGSIYTSKNPCYFMFGGTIGNFTSEEIIGILKNMKSRQWLKSSNIFLSYFPAPDKKKLTPEEYKIAKYKLKAMYGDPDENNPFHKLTNKAMEDFVLSWFEALGIPIYMKNATWDYILDEKLEKQLIYIKNDKGETKPNIEYVVKYEEAENGNPAMMKLGIKCNGNVDIRTKTGKNFHKKAGEYIRAVQSSRFTQEEFEWLAKKSWFNVVMNQSDEEWLVSAVALQSKLGMNDRNKKARNIISSVLIASTILSWWYFYQNYQEHKKEDEKIREYKQKMMYDKPLSYIENTAEMRDMSAVLMNEFISLYGLWSLTEDDIHKAFYTYLKEFSRWQETYQTLYANPKDKELQDKCVHDFVKNYFFEDMFRNDFDSIHPLPFLKWTEKDMIETLKYDGPIKEGYNEKDGLWYMAKAVGNIGKFKIDNENWWTEDIELVEWYLVPHECEEITIKTPEYSWNWNKRKVWDETDIYNHKDIILSVSETDADGYVTIKKRIVKNAKDGNGSFWDMQEKNKKLLFTLTDNYSSTNSNLSVYKDNIIGYFEHKDPIVKEILDTLGQQSGTARYYRWKKYALTKFIELKVMMIIDLYEDNEYWRNDIYYIKNNPKKISQYVSEFIQKHKKEIEAIQQGID